ncbi:hypothetical protein JCM8097_006542 [Rhodosporidiobolus ruineniae]
MLTGLFSSSSAPPESASAAPGLVVVLLVANSISREYIGQGTVGGRSAARKLHKQIEEELVGLGGEGAKVMVSSGPISSGETNATFDGFLSGFSSSMAKVSLVVPPASGDKGAVARMSQLAVSFLPVVSTSLVFLPTVDDDDFTDHLLDLPAEQSRKIVLIDTSPNKPVRLVSEGEFKLARGFEGLLVHEQVDEVETLFSTLSVSGEGTDRGETEQPNHISQPDAAQRYRFEPTDLLPAPTRIPPGPFQPPRLIFRDPWPCRSFYLDPAGCKFEFCKYSHDYDWSLEEWEKYPWVVKKTPCPWLMDQGFCLYGEDCFLGHARGSCAYERAGMPHAEELDDGGEAAAPEQNDTAAGGSWRRPYSNSRLPWRVPRDE